MRDRLRENLDALLERDPVLAGSLHAHPLFEALLKGKLSLPPPPLEPQLAEWQQAQTAALVPDRLHVLFGLSDVTYTVKSRSMHQVWVIEPVMEHFLRFMLHRPILPLLLRGRILVARSTDEIVNELKRFGSFLLIRHPLRGEELNAQLEALDGVLRVRAARVQALQRLNLRERLLERVREGSELAELLAGAPPREPVELQALAERIEKSGRPWTRTERLIVTMDCFK